MEKKGMLGHLNGGGWVDTNLLRSNAAGSFPIGRRKTTYGYPSREMCRSSGTPAGCVRVASARPGHHNRAAAWAPVLGRGRSGPPKSQAKRGCRGAHSAREGRSWGPRTLVLEGFSTGRGTSGRHLEPAFTITFN